MATPYILPMATPLDFIFAQQRFHPDGSSGFHPTATPWDFTEKEQTYLCSFG